MVLPEKLRFWGIGGIGMSALAQHLHHKGHRITGYDREPSYQTALLERLGIAVDYQPHPERIEEVEGIVYTPAISGDFPEWEAVKRLAKPTWRRAQALAHCLASYEVLAVAGAHGKTSTSAIITWLLHALGETPTAFVGGIMQNFGSNYVRGKNKWAVVEADEYDKALLLLHPAHAILQSVEPDHLEIYGSPAGVLEAYRAFFHQVKGLCVGPKSLPDLGRPLIRYELLRYSSKEGDVTFRYRWENKVREAHWRQIGRHFAENAAAALTLLELIGYPINSLTEALRSFDGIQRRMEIHRVNERYIIVSDYAHHPTEIRRTLQAIREAFPAFSTVAVFQPHLYSRTAFFAKDFAEALSYADEVVLLPIYAAREPSTPSVSSRLISQHLSKASREIVPLDMDMEYFSFLLLREKVVVALLGAGDIYRWVGPLYDYLRQESK
ncbi:MAG: cyanophycin synthetase [Bacteroidia bacterium]|nr:cyanophycin synthetase [Bacteroidia bacterium]